MEHFAEIKLLKTQNEIALFQHLRCFFLRLHSLSVLYLKIGDAIKSDIDISRFNVSNTLDL